LLRAHIARAALQRRAAIASYQRRAAMRRRAWQIRSAAQHRAHHLRHANAAHLFVFLVFIAAPLSSRKQLK